MSRTDPTQLEATARDLTACTYCHAQPGEWCRRVRRWDGARYATGLVLPGQRPPYAADLHQSRTGPLQRLESIGYCSGQRDAHASIVHEITNTALGQWRLSSLDRVVERCRELGAMWDRHAEAD